MRVRYKTDVNGKPIKQALIYTAEDHSLRSSDMAAEALTITAKLQNAGFKAFVVGGAIRDLLCGQKPKDFDIATDARPREIKRLFGNSRIIGRRFKLVHIYFSRGTIIEVATFRAAEQIEDEKGNNVFGQLEEDVFRRDFSFNSLYYCPRSNEIYDYVDGVQDIRNKKVHPVIPLKIIFKEDPVRIIRLIKYTTALDFKIPWKVRRQMKKDVKELANVSSSRLTEEFYKLLQNNHIYTVLCQFHRYGVLEYFLPALEKLIFRGSSQDKESFESAFMELNEEREKHGSIGKYRVMAYLLDYLLEKEGLYDSFPEMSKQDFIQSAKKFVRPLTPPNRELESALYYLLRKRKLITSKKAKSPGRRNRKKKPPRKTQGVSAQEKKQNPAAAP